MNWIIRFYKTRALANNGKFLLTVVALWVLFGKLLIPLYTPDEQGKQIYNLKGTTLKYDDHESVSHFLKSIKSNNGVLVLGTSESGTHAEGNYYDFINNDPDIKTGKMSVLAGAGRTCGIHIPMLLNHREEVDSLKLVYFINPIYWRLYFSDVSEYYWDRYVNYNVAKNVQLSDEEREAYYGPVQAYFDSLSEDKKVSLIMDDVIRRNRRAYFQDLRYSLNPEAYYNDLEYLEPNSKKLESFHKFGQVDYDLMDTTWNVLKSYLPNRGFRPIEESDHYRYDELRSFVRLCKYLNIDATFVVGPYNQQFISKYGGVPAFQRVVDNVKLILKQEDAQFIDASVISNETGAFSDFQHHSSYGAYLIYQQIKDELYER
jgi:hypothetical protein